MTVMGPSQAEWTGTIDAHNHIWIDPVPGAAPDSPVLNDPGRILSELSDYRLAGGAAIVDCQPGGCGRNANRLVWLSQQSDLPVIGCTGFHRRRYYPPEAPIWSLDEDQLARQFVSELQDGMAETRLTPQPAQAGFIKVAAEATLDETPQAALAAAAAAAVQTGAALQVHTEKGAQAGEVVEYFTQKGVAASQLLICHIDKRPDHGLHAELAQAGVMLEYDTFYRPKYDPQRNLWPLIDFMVASGLDHMVALATDLAESAQWQHYGGGPGLAAFPTDVRSRLAARNCDPAVIQRLTGGNIIRLLAGAQSRF
jgi:phosphotriesterase-related protein